MALTDLFADLFFYVVMLIVTLGIVISIHELGHYFAARFFKVKVEQFAFGFGKELFGITDKHKTRWSFCVFPIGGFVKLFGDVDPDNPVVWDHENKQERRLTENELKVAFCSKTVWQRLFIVFSGPLINIALTLFIFISVFTLNGQLSRPLEINALAMNAPAYEAGIRIGDRIVEMDGQKIRRLEDVYDYTKKDTLHPIYNYTVTRDGDNLDFSFAAKPIEYIDEKGVLQSHGQTGMLSLSAINFKDIYFVEDVQTKDNPDLARSEIIKKLDLQTKIGLSFQNNEKEKGIIDPFIVFIPSEINTHLNNPDHEHFDIVYLHDPEAPYYIKLGFFEAVSRSFTILKNILVKSYKILSAAIQGKNDDQIVAGVGKISEKTGEAAQSGVYSYLIFIAGFSFMIAFINLLPIPVLDGGYMVFLGYEAITGNPVSPRFQSIALIIGMVILGGIMIFANVSDLISLLSSVESG